MNVQKLTNKSKQAFTDAQSIAARYSNQTVDEQHLLYALAEQEDGFIPELLRATGTDPDGFRNAAEAAINRLPKVQTSSAADSIYISADLNRAMAEAESIAERMQDSYVSVEHILLGIIEAPNSEVKELFSAMGITKEKVLSALKELRGNQQVTSHDPEDTYNVLKSGVPNAIKIFKENAQFIIMQFLKIKIKIKIQKIIE